MFLLLAVIGLLTVFVLGAAFKRKNYWKNRGVKGPETTLFLGNLDVLGNPVSTQQPQIYHKWSKQYGPIYGVMRGWVPTLIVSTHELANEVLYEKFEEFHARDHAPIFGKEDWEPVMNPFVARGRRWRRLRAVSASAFTGKNLRIMYDELVGCSDRLIENLESDIREHGNKLDIKSNLFEFSGDVLSRLSFIEYKSREEMQKFNLVVHKLVQMPGLFVQFLSWITPQLWRLWKFFQIISMLSTNFPIFKFIFNLNKKIKAQREERTKDCVERNSADFMNIFLDYESSDVKMEDNTLYDKRNDKIVKSVNHPEILGMCFMFLFAGFDTVGSMSSLMVGYLAKNPVVQEKLRDEIEEICGRDQEPTYEQLQSLKYLDAVLKETLRLTSIGASVTSRRAACNTEIGGIPIEKDTHVVVDVISIHMDPVIFKDPEEFRPERWLGEDGAKLMTHFYGFGAGPRVCVGMKLAYSEIRIIFVKLLQHYRIKPTPQISEPVILTGLISCPESVPVVLEQL